MTPFLGRILGLFKGPHKNREPRDLTPELRSDPLLVKERVGAKRPGEVWFLFGPLSLCLFSLCLLLTLGACRAQTPPGPLPDRSEWYVSAELASTTQPGSYDLVLESYPKGALTLTPVPSGIRAEAQDQGTLRTIPTHVTLLTAVLPVLGIPGITAPPAEDTRLGIRWETTGLPPGLYTLSVTVPVEAADSTGKPFPTPAPIAGLPIYLPDPAGLRRAQAKYLGRRVWPAEFLDLHGPVRDADYTFAPPTSFRIKSITRLSQSDDLNMNGGDNRGASNDDFGTDHPLRVFFDQPHRVHFSASGWSGGGAEPRFQPPLFQDFADPWQMERALSLKPPSARTPKLRPGLTPAQVIVVLGWPTEYGSLAQLERRPLWHYGQMHPFDGIAYFSHGKFVRYDPGGHLP